DAHVVGAARPARWRDRLLDDRLLVGFLEVVGGCLFLALLQFLVRLGLRPRGGGWRGLRLLSRRGEQQVAGGIVGSLVGAPLGGVHEARLRLLAGGLFLAGGRLLAGRRFLPPRRAAGAARPAARLAGVLLDARLRVCRECGLLLRFLGRSFLRGRFGRRGFGRWRRLQIDAGEE